METPNKDTNYFFESEVSAQDLFKVLWINRLPVLLIAVMFFATSVFYSLTLNNIYTAESVLAPRASNVESSRLSQYSGIASIAGIDLGSQSGIAKKDLALELLRSKALLNRLINKYNILPDLMAAESWRISNNTVIYNNKSYDLENDTWVRNVSIPYQSIPSLQEAFEEFTNVITISEDPKSGIIIIKISHLSPFVAHQWLNWILQEVNIFVAEKTIDENQSSIEYLNEQVKVTPYAELRTMMFELIKQHTQNIMQAKVNPEYAFTIIDPPLIPERKSSPNRAFICILGFMLGIIIAVFVILIRFIFFNAKDKWALFNF